MPTETPRQTLVVAAYPSVDDLIKAAIPQWKRLHPNVDIRVLSRTFLDHHSVMAASLSTASNLPDVMALEADFIGQFATDNKLEDLLLPPFNARALQSRFVPFAVQQSTSRSGALVAIPADIGPGTMLYRADLLERSGVSVDELTRSWESFLAAGRKIKAATGAFLVPDAIAIAESLIQLAPQPGEGRYFDAKNQVLVDSPRFVRAFEIALRVRQEGLDANARAWNGNWTDGIRKGKIATVMSGAWMAGHFAKWLAPDAKGLWRVANLPEGLFASWGGTFYTIPKRSTGKALAWEFVQFMTLNRDLQLQAFKSQNAFPSLIEAQTDPFFDQPIEYLGGQKARLLWRDAGQRIVATQLHESDDLARNVVADELTEVLTKGKDIHQALGDAKRTLQRLTRPLAKAP